MTSSKDHQRSCWLAFEESHHINRVLWQIAGYNDAAFSDIPFSETGFWLCHGPHGATSSACRQRNILSMA